MDKFFFDWIGMKFNEYLEPTENERTLNLIVRLSQGVVGMILTVIVCIVWDQRQRVNKQKRQANKIIKDFNKTAKKSWK